MPCLIFNIIFFKDLAPYEMLWANVHTVENHKSTSGTL